MIPIFNRKFFPSACERFKSTFLYNSTKNISEFALWEIGGWGGGDNKFTSAYKRHVDIYFYHALLYNTNQNLKRDKILLL